MNFQEAMIMKVPVETTIRPSSRLMVAEEVVVMHDGLPRGLEIGYFSASETYVWRLKM